MFGFVSPSLVLFTRRVLIQVRPLCLHNLCTVCTYCGMYVSDGPGAHGVTEGTVNKD